MPTYIQGQGPVVFNTTNQDRFHGIAVGGRKRHKGHIINLTTIQPIVVYVQGQYPVIIGVTDGVRVEVSATGGRKRHKGHAIHLGAVKPVMIEVEAEFILYHYGADILAGEFDMTTQDGYLTLVNLEDIVGIEPHDDVGNNIPLTKAYSDRPAVGTFYIPPQPL